MFKKRLPWFVLSIITLCTVSTAIYFLGNGELLLNAFPLREKWITHLQGHVETLSTNGDHIIFARTGHQLYALDVQSGRILWQHDLAWQGIPQPPIAANGMVYLADGKTVWALDQLNGDVKWSQKTPVSSGSVDLVSGDIIVVEMPSYIYVLDAADGTDLWSKAECRYWGIQTYVDSSHLYSPCIDGMSVMNKTTGEVALEAKVSFEVAEVAYQDGVMYYLPDDNSASAMNLQNRRVIWKTGFYGDGFRTFSVAGSYIFVTGSDLFCIFQRETGDQVWCTRYNNAQDPTLIGDTLYVFNGYLNQITAFDIATGTIVGDISIRGVKLAVVEMKLMATTDEVLIFGNGSRVFAFGE